MEIFQVGYGASEPGYNLKFAMSWSTILLSYSWPSAVL